MLKELHLEYVGPAPQFDVEFGPRLNLFTGDNGLGKSFLLDIAWWVLTNTWVGNPARGQRGQKAQPRIRFRFSGSRNLPESKYALIISVGPDGRSIYPSRG
jgi:DNA repair ATPase RecN